MRWNFYEFKGSNDRSMLNYVLERLKMRLDPKQQLIQENSITIWSMWCVEKGRGKDFPQCVKIVIELYETSIEIRI